MSSLKRKPAAKHCIYGIENGWRAVQPFLDAWQQDASVELYAAGDDGPQAAEDLLTRDGRVWHGLG